MTRVQILSILTHTPIIGSGVVAGLWQENNKLVWSLGIGFSFN